MWKQRVGNNISESVPRVGRQFTVVRSEVFNEVLVLVQTT